jgi:hypothetical protein
MEKAGGKVQQLPPKNGDRGIVDPLKVMQDQPTR